MICLQMIYQRFATTKKQLVNTVLLNKSKLRVKDVAHRKWTKSISMPTHFFPLGEMRDVMDMHALIASEFGFYMPDRAPVYHIQHLAGVAEKRRNDRLKAAQEGKTYI